MAAFKNTDVSIYGTSQHNRPEVSDLVNLVPQWERRSRHFETASKLGYSPAPWSATVLRPLQQDNAHSNPRYTMPEFVGVDLTCCHLRQRPV